MEADSSQVTADLASAFDVSVKMVLDHLRQIENIEKLDKWVPREPIDTQREAHVQACINLQDIELRGFRVELLSAMKSGSSTMIVSGHHTG